MTKLIIIESPGKRKKLASILGRDYRIEASVGHIRDLPVKQMGVAPPDFKPEYELTERGKKVVATLKKAVQQAEVIYLATDPDREGEAISWHLKQVLRLKNYQRISFNEITEKAVKEALQHPGDIDYKMVGAQEARRVLDRLVGYMVSGALCQKSGERLSAGRVQSPAVRLVVERERDIQKFKVTAHYGACLFFDRNPDDWSAEWDTTGFVQEDFPYFLDRDFAERVSAIRSVVVKQYKKTKTHRAPPPAFTTATLQQAASVALKFSPGKTMQLAQKLYEQGHITYHRTDNPNISEEALPDIIRCAKMNGLNISGQLRTVNVSSDAQAGHPAITPTHWMTETAGETEEMRALYRLIRLRAIASQLEDAHYDVATVVLEAEDSLDGKTILFKGRSQTLTKPGWLALTHHDPVNDSVNEDAKQASGEIPVLTVGQKLTATSGELLSKKTRPPKRYTEAALIKRLEKEGIGRPATYAAIMSNIIQRGYIEIKKRYLVPTPKGERVVDALTGNFDFMSLSFTRQIEKELDAIAKGQTMYKKVVQTVYDTLEKNIKTIHIDAMGKTASSFEKNTDNKNADHKNTNNEDCPQCPKCEKPMRKRHGKHGYFWGCSGYPACKETQPVQTLKSKDFVCPTCQSPLVHRVKKGKNGYDFWGCSSFSKGCRTRFKNKNGAPDF